MAGTDPSAPGPLRRRLDQGGRVLRPRPSLLSDAQYIRRRQFSGRRRLDPPRRAAAADLRHARRQFRQFGADVRGYADADLRRAVEPRDIRLLPSFRRRSRPAPVGHARPARRSPVRRRRAGGDPQKRSSRTVACGRLCLFGQGARAGRRRRDFQRPRHSRLSLRAEGRCLRAAVGRFPAAGADRDGARQRQFRDQRRVLL